MDTWDPRRDDYQSAFNSYDRGPGKNLPRKTDEGSYGGTVQLFIHGIPREMTEDGLRNLFVKAGNVRRVKIPPPKSESQTPFGFVTMGSVREAEEAIRRYHGFRIDRFTMKVQVAKSEEQKKKEQQQRQEDEIFFSSLQSFKGKTYIRKSSSDTDSDRGQPKASGKLVNGISEKPKASTPMKGKGRGQVLEELSGGVADEQKALNDRVQKVLNERENKTLNERFKQEPAQIPRRLSPGDSYKVEDLTITVADQTVKTQHSVKTKDEEIKLTHTANNPVKPNKLKSLVYTEPNPSYPNRGMGRGSGMHRGGYNQTTGMGMYGWDQQYQRGYQQDQSHFGGYQRGRGFNRYEAYTSGYANYNDRFCRESYGGPQLSMYNSAPTYSPYAAGLLGHYPGSHPQDPYRGFQTHPGQMGPYGDPYLLTPAPPPVNPTLQLPGYNSNIVNQPAAMAMNRSSINISAAHSPAVSAAGDQPEGQSCSVCEKIGHSRCGRCKTPYCSKECQREDWPRHKQICKEIRKGHEQAEEFEKTFDVTVGDEMIENMKGLIEKFTGEQVEVTKKPTPASQTTMKKSQEMRDKTDKSPASTGGKSADGGDGSRVKAAQKSGEDRVAEKEANQTKTKLKDEKGKQTEKKGKTGNSVCYNCHKRGHFSRECPDKKSGAKTVTCHKCGQSGHYKGECRNLEQKGKARDDHRSDRNNNNQSRDEPGWDDPAPSKTGEPVAHSTPSTTPKPAVQSSTAVKTVAEKHVVPAAILPLNTETVVVVTEILSPNMIWCQIVSEENMGPLQEIMGKMAEKYSNSKPDLAKVARGQYCGVQFSQDQQWYRGQVINKSSDKEFMVQFIDFGNQETRTLSDLRDIDREWLQHPAQAIHCYLEDICPPATQTTYSIPADTLQTIIPSNAPYTVTAKAQREGQPGFPKYGVVMINKENENIALKLVEAGLAGRKQPGAVSPRLPIQSSQEQSGVILMKEVGCLATEMTVGQEIYIMITDAISPANFTVHIIEEERIAAFKKFSDQLKSVESDPVYKPTSVGELVVAKFSIDGSWYRAQVLSISDKQVEVTYIDFGNSESVELKNVRKPKPYCKSMPAQAMRCCLSGFKLPESETLASKVLLAFVDLVSLAAPVKLKSVIKDVKNNIAMLEVFSAEGNKSVNSELESLSSPKHNANKSEEPAALVAGKDIAIPEGKLPVDGTTVQAQVTEIESNISFYVQRFEDSGRLQMVMKELNDPDKMADEDKPSDIHVGDCVAAVFDDGDNSLWYRAKVKELISGDQLKVLYIDYGNTATVSRTSVKRLSFDMRHIPALAIQCELLGSDGPDSQVTEDFKCMLNQTANVKASAQRNNHYIVELILTNDNVTSVNTVLGLDTSKISESFTEALAEGAGKQQVTSFPILPLPLNGSSVNVAVVHIERLDLFCVQLQEAKYRVKLAALMSELQESCSKNANPYSPKDGECITAQFDDGDSILWHRAKSLGPDNSCKDKFLVEFVDYGNTGSATKEMIRVLDPQFAEVPALAVRCKLAGSTGKEKKELIEEFKSVMYQPVPLKIRALKLNSDVYEVEMNLDSDKVEKTDVSEILGLRERVTEAPVVNTSECPVATAKPKSSPNKEETDEKHLVTLKQIELPLDGSTVQGAVVFIESLQSCFVQLHDETLQEGLAQMMKELNTGLVASKSYQPKVGDIVAAQYTEGGTAMWYRARVIKLGDDMLQVFFVDYGNTEKVKKEEVHRLSENFLTQPQMAVKCQLRGCQGVENQELLQAFSCIQNQPLLVKARKRTSFGYEIDLITNDGKNVSDLLGFPLESNVTNDASQEVGTTDQVRSSVQKELEVFKLPLDGTEVPGAVMAIESLQCFFVHIQNPDLQLELGGMMSELQEYCSSAQRPYTPAAGEVVAALYTDAGETLWYRARVKQILRNSESLEVLFVDYGNTEIIGKNEVCRLSEKFLHLPQGSVTCKLVGSTGKEDPKLVKEFELVLKIRLLVKAVDYSNGVYAIELLTDDGININDQLGLITGQGPHSPVAVHAEPTDKTTPPKQEALPRKSVSPQHGIAGDRKVVFTQTLPVFVPKVKEFQLMMTSVTTPDLFHAQIVDKEHDYRTDLALQTHRMMLEFESEPAQDEVQYEVGELCCAKYASDGSWYRASILKLYPDKSAQVEYVDYGNTELVPMSLIRPITNDYVELPILAFKGKLAGVYPTGERWSKESSDKMKICLNKVLSGTLVNVHKDVYELKLVEPESKADIGEMLIKAGVASETPRTPGDASEGRRASPQSQEAAEPLSETERLQRENEIMKQQLAAMQAQMAELLKQKN